MITYASHTLSKSEKNYDAHKLEFLALKWSVTERLHEYLYSGHFEVYTDNLLTCILTTAKFDVTGQRWVSSLANYNFKIFYKSGTLNMDADALSQIPWKNTQVDHMVPLVVKAMLQSKLVTNVEILEVYPQLEVVQKSLIADSSPKLNNNDWIREQSEHPNTNLNIQLLKSEKLKVYVAKELDSSELPCSFDVWQRLAYEKWITVLESSAEKSPKCILQFVLPKGFVQKEILACHDDNGHVHMERTLGLLQERFFWHKMADDVCIHICTCDQCTRFKHPQD